jgi:hypothetical protein
LEKQINDISCSFIISLIISLRMKRLLVPVLLFLLGFVPLVGFAPVVAFAQELDCQVEINLSALPEQDRVQWQTFKGDVQNYINSYSWATNFSGDKIRCTFQFNIVGTNGANFDAQLFVTSSRPLYKSDQVTTMARFFDDKLEFPYSRGQVLQHGSGFRMFESVIDYYVYIVLGLDYDSYQRQGGTMYFQQANELATIALSAGARGWERATSSTGAFSRVGYIADVLNANARVVRDLTFEYTYGALDLETTKPDQARAQIATVIDNLQKQFCSDVL